MAWSAPQSLWLLLRDPSTFFEEHEPAATFPVAAGVVVALAVAAGLSTLLLGSMLAGAIDGTVTMDNPDRPPEWVCDGHGPDSSFDGDCDEPETIERDAGSLVSEAVTDYLGYMVVAPFVMWLLAGIVLFAAGRLAAGSPSVTGTFALAGWAALPEFFRLTVGLVALQAVLSDLTITNLEGSPEVIEAAFAPIQPFLALATVLTVLWQWYLLTGGLEHEANLTRSAAATAVGVPLGVLLLVALI
ncbi:Yip1 family protein [Natrinema ejinorense]|uniref:YIP1 family protein n=1 Tax=Natrinema ejinorense TaxID=373386 RepID=A0A2A5QXW8_9EURY|nr:Yip1 family protein [Natrinema ejinorense]PCR91644.1 YIP1 family protein [Natrinema ejinorense]